jgi:hypothetical protein
MATTKLVQQIKMLLSKPTPENGADAAQAGGEIPSAPTIDIPLIYIRDDFAPSTSPAVIQCFLANGQVLRQIGTLRAESAQRFGIFC